MGEALVVAGGWDGRGALGGSACVADCGTCAPTCGNGACDGAEMCSTCPGDCRACMTSCSPATCAGCCVAGVCESGTAATSCGTGGNLCMMCGSGLACSGGACVTDPASRWNLVLDSLSVMTTNYEGAAWDAFGGAADPVVRIYIGSETATPIMVNGPDDTHTITYSGAPNATDVRASALLAHLDFRVYDEDVSDYEFIGWCSASVPAAAFTGAQQTVTCPVDAATGGSGYTLRWHLEPF